MSMKNKIERMRKAYIRRGKGIYWLPKKYLEGKEQYQEVDVAINELTRLCRYLLLNFEDEVGKDENAVDMAIRLLDKSKSNKKVYIITGVDDKKHIVKEG